MGTRQDKRAVVEQKVNIEVLTAHLNAIFFLNKGEVFAELKNKLFQVFMV